MVISDKYKCIFIRIPKTGSTTIEKALIAADPDCISSDNSTPPYGHYQASEVRRIAGEERWNSYYKFSVVRDPYEWVKSNYMDHCRFIIDEGDVAKTVWAMLTPDRSLPWPDHMEGTGDVAIRETHLLTLVSMIQFWWHGDFMDGGKHGKLVGQHSWLNEEMDSVAKLENINQDWKVICKHIGLENDKLGKENVNQTKKDMTVVLDYGAQKLVDVIYHHDFLAFGYDKKPSVY